MSLSRGGRSSRTVADTRLLAQLVSLMRSSGLHYGFSQSLPIYVDVLYCCVYLYMCSVLVYVYTCLHVCDRMTVFVFVYIHTYSVIVYVLV